MRKICIFLTLLFLAVPAAAFSEKRVALVIGNSAYQHVPRLANPKNDAADMAAKLEGLGFEVIHGEDLSLSAMRDTARKFISKLSDANLSLFFYAGHGLQVNGSNYMAPIDAKLASFNDLDFETMPMDLIVTAMERNTLVNLVFLDACRDNPLAENLARSMGSRSGAVGRGLAKLGTGVGSLIAFATQPGNVALDGDGRNSPFTTALLKHLGTPGQDITRELVLVRRDVLEATGGKQVPWDNSSLTTEIILNPQILSDQTEVPEASATVQSNSEIAGMAEVTFWNSIKDSSDTAYFIAYLKQFPSGQFAEIARLKIGDIEKSRGAVKQALGEVGAFDRSQLDKLDPSKALPEKPGIAKSTPASVEASLDLGPDDLSKIKGALELFGYKVDKNIGQLSKTDRASLRKFQIRNRIPESGYIDQASLEKLIDEVAAIPKDYGGKWIMNFHRYQYGPHDPSGVNLRTLMATATAELRDGEFYIVTSRTNTSKQNPFDTFSGTLSNDGQFNIAITIDTLFDDEGEKVQVVKAKASEKLPKLIAYEQPIYIRGSRLWLNRKKGEDVSLRIELIRVR